MKYLMNLQLSTICFGYFRAIFKLNLGGYIYMYLYILQCRKRRVRVYFVILFI